VREEDLRVAGEAALLVAKGGVVELALHYVGDDNGCVDVAGIGFAVALALAFVFEGAQAVI